MTTIQKLKELGESMGLGGKDLVAFVKEQQAEERAQRALDRQHELERIKLEATKTQADKEVQVEKIKAEKDKELKELKEKELEQKAKELDFEREKLEREHELKKLALEKSVSEEETETSSVHGSPRRNRPQGPKLPCFEDGKDDLDAYLSRFERTADIQGWKIEDRALYLSALLRGRALDVYSRLPAAQANDYETLKKALLRRYELTEEGFKTKFRTSRPEKGESPMEFATRLSSYLYRWIQLSGIEKTFEELITLLVKEQFLSCCSKEMALFLKERAPDDLDDMMELAQQYLEAHATRGYSAKDKSENIQQRTTGGSVDSNRVRKCFECGSEKHIAKYCPDKRSAGQRSPQRGRIRYDNERPGPKKCWLCDRTGHMAHECWTRKKMKETAMAMVRQDDENRIASSREDLSKPGSSKVEGVNVCNACIKCEVLRFPCGHEWPLIADACDIQNGSKVKMPVVEGRLGDRQVTVLRDTGCSTVVVRRSLVPDSQLAGTYTVCVLIDGTKRKVPVADVIIESPYFTGKVRALCMKNPIYDVIVGNVPGVNDIGIENVKDDMKAAVDTVLGVEHGVGVVTRSQSVKKPEKPLTVSIDGAGDVSGNEVKTMQQKDNTLTKIWNKWLTDKASNQDDSEVQFMENKGLKYRQVDKGGRRVMQLLVPGELRQRVLKLAHEGIMSGHQGIGRTTERVTSAFWWPGLQADVTRFCRSCDICQRTTHKGRVGKVPLGNVPIIQTPFSRVAVDLVGPMYPATDRGHRYLLTLVDYATRYPEAVPLKNIETETVAEAMVTIFSRIGVPSEVLSDQGTQFMSCVMKEVSRLLSIRQLVTTPYHPQCNGLVERFNGTLKEMLKKMCAEKPTDWDRYVAPLLFAYREVPQASLGFSPFEMLYGRTMRGPMKILKELWTNEVESEEVKSTYQYVLDLRERLQDTCELAHQHLKKAQQTQKKFFDCKTKDRVFNKGDKVLLLLPTANSKLLMQWQGPFEVLERCGGCDYRIQLPNRVRLFHANMLKKYWEREEISEGTVLTGAAILEPVDLEDDEIAPLSLISGEQTETYEDVEINQSLTNEQQKQVRQLLYEFRDIFTDVPHITNLGEHEIKLTSDDPIRGKAYPVPHAMKAILEKELEAMLKMGIIEPSTAAYASPIVMVRKPDSSTRVCVDYRKLNRVTVFDPEPIPSVESIFAKLSGDRYFSKFDCCKGYWQVAMKEEDRNLTTFVCHRGLYRFRVMPFGLVNAPATFSRIMRRLLKDGNGLDNYLDDILAHTDTWSRHVMCLRDLFERARKAKLALKPSKCSIGEFGVSFLGFQLSEGTLSPKDDTVSKILQAPRPVTKKQVRAFLGLVGFYRKFVPNFAAVAVPLTDLTRKGSASEVVWEEPQERAFAELKACIANPPILKLPDLNQAFILQTDASNTGIGAVLLQESIDNVKHPVAYASRKLLPREVNYSTIEKECLAIVWAIGKFQEYLYGKEFILETDHQPLQYLGAAQFQNGRLMRWALALQPYRFILRAIRGKDNVGADYLSRNPCTEDETS